MANLGYEFPAYQVSDGETMNSFLRKRVEELIDRLKPTIWMGIQPLLGQHDLSSLHTILSGGSAVPKTLSAAYREAIGVPIMQGWGMTETSPVATYSRPHTQHDGGSEDERDDARARQGFAAPLVELRIADPATGAPSVGIAPSSTSQTQ